MRLSFLEEHDVSQPCGLNMSALAWKAVTVSPQAETIVSNGVRDLWGCRLPRSPLQGPPQSATHCCLWVVGSATWPHPSRSARVFRPFGPSALTLYQFSGSCFTIPLPPPPKHTSHCCGGKSTARARPTSQHTQPPQLPTTCGREVRQVRAIVQIVILLMSRDLILSHQRQNSTPRVCPLLRVWAGRLALPAFGLEPSLVCVTHSLKNGRPSCRH